jgi:hypothetical protein
MEAESRWARQGGLAKDYVKSAGLPNYLDLIYAKPLRKALPGGVGLIE